jgi:hypothetical protein
MKSTMRWWGVGACVCGLLAGCSGGPFPDNGSGITGEQAPALAGALTGSACIAGQPGQWMTQSIARQTGRFSFDFDVSPTANNTDAVVGLANGPTTDYENLAANIRFNNVGKIDAKSGESYMADSAIPYSAGVVYHAHMAIDLPNHRYSVWVTPAGQARQLLASGYLFRGSQLSQTALDGYAASVDSAALGTIEACNPVLGPAEPVPGCTSATRGQPFVTSPLPPQSGSFVLDFNVYTAADISDEVMGLVQGTASGYSSLAANVRFNDQWVVDVRKGGTYAAENRMFYGAHWLHFRMAVNVPAHTYSVWGWDQSTSGKAVVKLATDFPFRTERQSVTSLNGYAHFVDPAAQYQTTNTICGAIISN